MSSESKEYYHNKGEKDYQKGKYEKPNPTGGSLHSHIFGGADEEVEENKSYDEGYQNAKKQDTSNDPCFLTTACVKYAGLADDCHELQVLRRFRDTYVSSLPDGQAILVEYYQSAPTIVRNIQSSEQRDSVLEAVFGTVGKAVELIEAGRHRQAFDSYAACSRN